MTVASPNGIMPWEELFISYTREDGSGLVIYRYVDSMIKVTLRPFLNSAVMCYFNPQDKFQSLKY